MEYLELLLKGLVVLFPIAFCWMLITYKWSFRKIEKEPMKSVTLHLFDNIEQADEALNGIKMELIDAAFPLLKGVIATMDIVEACKDINIVVMLGGFPRKEGMERTDMMSKNVSIHGSSFGIGQACCCGLQGSVSIYIL
ncbi:hypothetical protein CMV_026261 [Castanea mollissima]|uniref:Lactate/malate dehydrogenase N-terminal domain-containing protein n=1 Tax=Castanea mollissima TaxID=60419 RepID=A0A8J4QBG2_9ROSI|nr:hypothetical protein CMV_026261 [Castanea mollissima]